jgi:hypothetical protein
VISFQFEPLWHGPAMNNKIQNLFTRLGGASCAARVALALLALCALRSSLCTAEAQGTAFTYQGRLNSSGSPANGNYDFTFALFNNSGTNTGQVGGALTNLDVGVTNGLFTVTLDFGAVFAGNATWLAIGVRTNGGTNFTALSPSQELTPAPYAIYAPNAGSAASANSVAATNITGTINAAILPPTIGNTTVHSNLVVSNQITAQAGVFYSSLSLNGSGVLVNGMTNAVTFWGPVNFMANVTIGGVIGTNNYYANLAVNPGFIIQGYVNNANYLPGWNTCMFPIAADAPYIMPTYSTDTDTGWVFANYGQTPENIGLAVDANYPAGAEYSELKGNGQLALTYEGCCGGAETDSIPMFYLVDKYFLNNNNGTNLTWFTTNTLGFKWSAVTGFTIGQAAAKWGAITNVLLNISTNGKITGNFVAPPPAIVTLNGSANFSAAGTPPTNTVTFVNETASTNTTIKLPAPSSYPGYRFIIEYSGNTTNKLTLVPSEGATRINGALNLVMSNQYSCVELIADNTTNWWVASQYMTNTPASQLTGTIPASILNSTLDAVVITNVTAAFSNSVCQAYIPLVYAGQTWYLPLTTNVPVVSLVAPTIYDATDAGLMTISNSNPGTVSSFNFYCNNNASTNGGSYVLIQSGSSPTYQDYRDYWYKGSVTIGVVESPLSTPAQSQN